MHVGCWRFFKVVEHVVTHDGWMDGGNTKVLFFSTKVTIMIAEVTSV